MTQPLSAGVQFTQAKPKSSDPKRRSRRKGQSDHSTKNPATSKINFEIKPGEKPVRIWSLMGLEQVGQCIFIEYENDIILIDAGMEFSGNQETLGADYIIPDIRYVQKNINKLRGIVLSHGHLDHVGALRDLLPMLNFPTIYTTPLTLGIVKKTFDNKDDVAKIKAKIINPEIDILKLGCFTIEFCHVNHNIPETMAMAIHTPKGMIFNSSDFKFDYTPAIDKPADIKKLARIGSEGVKLYIGDSLGAHKPGRAISEKQIWENLERIIRETPGRIIVATFASNVGRVIQLMQSAVKNDRVILLSGRSMENNVAICQELGYITAPKSMIRSIKKSWWDAENLPPNRVMIISTGAQGEEFAGLARMARGEHPQIQLWAGDTILLSSSVIPGNEIQMQDMMNSLVVRGVNLITNGDMDIHASGHGGAEDHKLMLNLMDPEYFLPYYLDAYMRYEHRKLWLQVGLPDERILMPNENWAIIELYDNGCKISDEKLNLDTVMIDGKGVGHLSGEYVIKARQIMAHDGVIVLVFPIDSSGALIGNVQIESRGFVYSSEVRSIHAKIIDRAKQLYKQLRSKWLEQKDITRTIKEEMADFTIAELDREPMIIPICNILKPDTAPQT
jgi:ribonuclease J